MYHQSQSEKKDGERKTLLSTCGVYSASLVCVVLQQHGRALIDQDIHTLHVTLKRSQTQSRVTLRRPHVQIQQRLDQNLKSVVVTVICLEKTVRLMNNIIWLKRCLL